MRKRVAASKLKSWDEVDDCLKFVGLIDLKLQQIEGELNIAVISAKEAAAKAAAPLIEKKELLELAMKEYAEEHREDFGDRKSRALTFGTVSFRVSTRILITNAKKCVEQLKALGLRKYLIIKESPNKDEMAALDDATLAKVGAKRKTEDAFGYEVDFEKLKGEVTA
ncbi:MAG: host-nuclease inhibitor Gam family protein [Nitrospiraceae bacterium]|nr:host-nuclease inhibitor Gam family protein [Nitrospiraceae bacterium]